ncbi:hypothetical protein VTN96DRAFT_6013 [Rasamsonia emersonii]
MAPRIPCALQAGIFLRPDDALHRHSLRGGWGWDQQRRLAVWLDSCLLIGLRRPSICRHHLARVLAFAIGLS